MNKISFFTKDKNLTLEFTKVFLVTINYELKINKDYLFMPLAAKLIVYDLNNVMHSFLLLKPLIKSDHAGDIIVMINSKWKNVSRQEDYFLNFKAFEKKLKLYAAKKTIGLFPNEIWALQDLKALKELTTLIKKKYQTKEGAWV